MIDPPKVFFICLPSGLNDEFLTLASLPFESMPHKKDEPVKHW